MTKTVHLDFETRAKVDIWETGAWRYAEDEDTEILCLAYAVDDGPVELIKKEEIEHEMFAPAALDALKELAKDENVLFCAHNAFFEQSVWANILEKRYGWPSLPINRWRCSAAKAAACTLPRALEKAAKALNLPMQKDMSGSATMKKMSKPRKPTKNNPAIWHETPEQFEILHAYCIQDVEVERLIDQRLPDLIPFEQQVWFLDQKINFRGVQLDRDLVESSLEVFRKYESDLIEKIKVFTNGYLDGVSRRNRILDWLKDQGVELEGLTKAIVSDALKRDDLPENARLLLEARRSLGKTSIAKFVAMQNSMDKGGRLRDLLMYHGAGPGRWAGKLVQLQNLPRGNVKDIDLCVKFIKQRKYGLLDMMYSDITGAISSCIRGAIISKPGFDLLVSDYASIETRVLFWLAGEINGLEKIKRGVDLYVDMAKIIYDKPDLTKEDKAERQLGKQAILGLGYGQGDKKFKMVCDSYDMDVSSELAKKAVEIYRETYISVTKFWYTQEASAKKAIRTGEVVTCGKIKWAKKGAFLICLLPSSRAMVYYQPKIQMLMAPWGQEKETITYMSVNSVTKQYERTSTRGAKLVENIVQATARDLMANAMLVCEKAGYPIVMTIHDELVSEVPENFGSVEEFEKLMCELPAWAEGCPVEAEGWRGKRYRK